MNLNQNKPKPSPQCYLQSILQLQVLFLGPLCCPDVCWPQSHHLVLPSLLVLRLKTQRCLWPVRYPDERIRAIFCLGMGGKSVWGLVVRLHPCLCCLYVYCSCCSSFHALSPSLYLLFTLQNPLVLYPERSVCKVTFYPADCCSYHFQRHLSLV